MNKKITVIELFNKIVNGEEVPKNIKVEGKEYCLDGSTYYTVGEDDEDLFCLESYTNTLNFLKLEVEILEDNPDEIKDKVIDMMANELRDTCHFEYMSRKEIKEYFYNKVEIPEEN